MKYTTPQWFNLANYAVLENANFESLDEIIDTRRNFNKFLEDHKGVNKNKLFMINDKEINLHGGVVFMAQSKTFAELCDSFFAEASLEKFFKFMLKRHQYRDESVDLLNFLDMALLSNYLDNLKFFIKNKENDQDVIPPMLVSDILKLVKNAFKEQSDIEERFSPMARKLIHSYEDIAFNTIVNRLGFRKHGNSKLERDVVGLIDDLLYKPCFDNASSRIFLSVDLDKTDAQIMEDFANLISNCRKQLEQNRQKPYVSLEKKLKKIVDNKIIPYIDLYLWGKYTGKKMTYQQITNLLFNEYEDVERVRQTIHKNALHLLDVGLAHYIGDK